MTSEIDLDDEAAKLAEEIATIIGEDTTTAVVESLRERLAVLKRRGLADRLIAVGRESAAQLNASGRRMMEVEDLYDQETGLPK